MAQNRKLTCLIVFIFSVIFSGCNIYKMLSTSEEDLKQFLCQHVNRDAHKDMLRRHHPKHHHDDKVRSHTIEVEKESFEEKLKHDSNDKAKETEYHLKIVGENKCRRAITHKQLTGMKFLNKMGLITSVCSLVAALVGFAALKGRSDGSNRFLLLPYIVIHPMLIGIEVYAAIYTYQLVHKLSTFHIIMMVLSCLLIVIFTALVVLYYKALAGMVEVGGEEPGFAKGKEALDFKYGVMTEEKEDASEA